MNTPVVTDHGVRRASEARLPWLDHLRIAVTVLVVVHHAAQPYGPDDWWYVQSHPRSDALATLSALDGTFAMSLFFFVSAYFVPSSYQRHGVWAFAKGRLRRLGIPLVVGALTIVPGLMYAYYVHYRGYQPISYAHYFTDVYLGVGDKPDDWSGPSWPDLQFAHLWFVQNLLVYSMLYLLCRQAARLLRSGPHTSRPTRVPGHGALVLLTLALATATFAVRLRYRLDTWVPFLDFIQVEPARLPLQAGYFVLGVLAHRFGWLERFPARSGWIWLVGGLVGAVVLFVVGPHAACFATGGASWQSALWALYESGLCVALCTGLLTLFRELRMAPGPVSRELSAGAYTVYIVHLPIVVAVQFALVGLPALGAWAATAVFGTVMAFVAAAMVRRLPGFRSVL
ncbi:acyltransferase family protein [Streptomyces sp. MK37H]|uniref:acyltransferase family protein n=1 Tax=Streptomyces sp. MK37H TaxID=2699117 RepID=UPI001B35BDA1|nr:acyltransferase family protein [Streptomyces sp. MK37H]MBP8534568.1 acyltransferase family protein [Streptomyces sp. MK37H]